MNKKLLDKIVSIHEEIENVKNKIKLVNVDDIPYVLYGDNGHLICSDRTIISDAISFIKERYEANLADLQAELNKYEIVDSVAKTGVSDRPDFAWVKWVAKDYDKRIWAYSEKPRKSKNVWRSDDMAPKQISTEQTVSLCGRVPEWADEEPTPVINR